MPEGDTILRTARTLDRWLGGRRLTRAESRVSTVHLDHLVGVAVEGVEARAKHVLVGFANGEVLHTHQRMHGSWHVYRSGERWRQAPTAARVILEAGERTAVCFRAPVVELLRRREVEHRLAGLGPDVLRAGFDTEDIAGRIAPDDPAASVGDVLLDQRVVSGIGNIWRCEALFVAGVHPATPLCELAPGDLERLAATASRLMAASVEGRRPAPWVYGRARRPCRRCGSVILSGRMGRWARTAYWCPRCQPAPHGWVEPARRR